MLLYSGYLNLNHEKTNSNQNVTVEKIVMFLKTFGH